MSTVYTKVATKAPFGATASVGSVAVFDQEPVGSEHRGCQPSSAASSDVAAAFDHEPVESKRRGCQPSSDETDEDDIAENLSPSKYTPANRVRYCKTGDVDFVVKSQLTIKGGYLAEARLLDTTMMDGIEMMNVRGRDPWLVATATGMSHRRDSAFETGVRICLLYTSPSPRDRG